MQTVFGDPTRFAIEAERSGPWSQGGSSKQLKFRFWIGSEAIGEYWNTVVAATTAMYLKRFVNAAPTRHCAPFVENDPGLVLDLVYSWAFGDAPLSPEALANAVELSMAFRNYVLTEVAVPALDKWQIVAIRYSEVERLVWRSADPIQSARDIKLPAAQFDSVVQEFGAWVDEQLGQFTS